MALIWRIPGDLSSLPKFKMIWHVFVHYCLLFYTTFYLGQTQEYFWRCNSAIYSSATPPKNAPFFSRTKNHSSKQMRNKSTAFFRGTSLISLRCFWSRAIVHKRCPIKPLGWLLKQNKVNQENGTVFSIRIDFWNCMDAFPCASQGKGEELPLVAQRPLCRLLW